MTNRTSVAKMVQLALDHFQRIDILVNTAGFVRDAQPSKMSEENFDLVIDVNLKGVFSCTRAVVPTMNKQGSGVHQLNSFRATQIAYCIRQGRCAMLLLL